MKHLTIFLEENIDLHDFLSVITAMQSISLVTGQIFTNSTPGHPETLEILLNIRLAFSQILDYLDNIFYFSLEIQLLTQSFYLLHEYEYSSDNF